MLRVYIHYPTDVKEPAFSFFSEASSEIASKALLTEEVSSSLAHSCVFTDPLVFC